MIYHPPRERASRVDARGDFFLAGEYTTINPMRRRRAFDASTPIGRVSISTAACQAYTNVLQRKLGVLTLNTLSREQPQLTIQPPKRRKRDRAPEPCIPAAALARPTLHPSVSIRCVVCGEAASTGMLFVGCSATPWNPACDVHKGGGGGGAE